MKTLFLIALFLLIPFEILAMCLDRKIDPKVKKLLQEADKPTLDPKNEAVVPLGLPESKYPVCAVETKATTNGNALVFITLSEKRGDNRFMVPFIFLRKVRGRVVHPEQSRRA